MTRLWRPCLGPLGTDSSALWTTSLAIRNVEATRLRAAIKRLLGASPRAHATEEETEAVSAALKALGEEG